MTKFSSSPTVAVGMSGGVDSSVAALLLKQKGYQVIGMFMKNWEEKESNGLCQSQADLEDVVRVCDRLNIPFYTVNFVKEYWDEVFTTFLDDLQKGLTPNPDILCNQKIKFHFFLQKALSLGADFLATGHYAQIEDQSLIKAKDQNKDQTYFLYTLSQKHLSSILFPIGGLEKKEVRFLAKENHLPVHNKKDSTGICFIGKRNFKEFVNRYLPLTPGPINTLEGKTIGEHCGAIFYTIGQRKGLGIGGEGEAWYIAGKEMKTNTLLVVQGDSHPALYANDLIAIKPHFIGSNPDLPLNCSAKIRYRQQQQTCIVEKSDNESLHVHFHLPQRAITPGQSIVFYHHEKCIGGATILKARSPYLP